MDALGRSAIASRAIANSEEVPLKYLSSNSPMFGASSTLAYLNKNIESQNAALGVGVFPRPLGNLILPALESDLSQSIADPFHGLATLDDYFDLASSVNYFSARLIASSQITAALGVGVFPRPLGNLISYTYDSDLSSNNNLFSNSAGLINSYQFSVNSRLFNNLSTLTVYSLLSSQSLLFNSSSYLSFQNDYAATTQLFNSQATLYYQLTLNANNNLITARLSTQNQIATLGVGVFPRPIANLILPLTTIKGFSTQSQLFNSVADITDACLLSTNTNLVFSISQLNCATIFSSFTLLFNYPSPLYFYLPLLATEKLLTIIALLTKANVLVKDMRIKWTNNNPINSLTKICFHDLRPILIKQSKINSSIGNIENNLTQVNYNTGELSAKSLNSVWATGINQEKVIGIKYNIGIQKNQAYRINYTESALKAEQIKIHYGVGNPSQFRRDILYYSTSGFSLHQRLTWKTIDLYVHFIRSIISNGEITRSGIGIKNYVPWIRPDRIIAESTAPFGLILPGNFSKKLITLSFGANGRYYLVNNTASFTVNNNDIPVTALSISASIDSFTYSFSASIPLLDVDIAVGQTAIINLNSTLFYGIIETITQSMSFASKSLNVSGRSLNCLLTAPWSVPIARYSNAFPYSAITIANNLVSNVVCKKYSENPLSFTVAFHSDYAGLQDNWVIPEGEFNFEDKTVHEALNEIAQAAGGIIQPDFSNLALTIIRKWPLAPWKWNSAAWTSASKLTLSPDSIKDISTSYEQKEDFNKTILAGVLGAGLIYIGKITGTDGLECQGVSINRLFTSAAVMREYAIKRIATDLSIYKRNIDTFYAPSIVPLLWPGRLIEVSNLYKGLITSVKLDAKNGDRLEIGQSIEIICLE